MILIIIDSNKDIIPEIMIILRPERIISEKSPKLCVGFTEESIVLYEIIC